MKWDELAYVILAIEATAWLVAEIGGLKTIGYGIVILSLVVFFWHLMRFKKVQEE